MYSKNRFLIAQGKELLLLFFLLLMNCENENSDTNKNNYVVPETSISMIENYTEIETNKFSNYSDGLEYVMKDEGDLLKLNNIKLLSYKLLTDSEYKKGSDFDNKHTIILERYDFEGDTKQTYSKKDYNKYSINVVPNSSDVNKDFLLKKKKFISNILINEPDLKMVSLNWLINGEELNTIAYFKKGALLYDDILSNYIILDIDDSTTEGSLSKNNATNKTTSTTNNDYYPYDCASQYYGTDYPIYFSDGIYRHSITDTYLGEIAYASCSLNLHGIQLASDCSKYLNGGSGNGDYGGSAWATADAKVEATLKGFSPYTGPGYCDYKMAIALQTKPYWSNVKISISYQGSGFTVTSNPNGGSVTFQQKFGYATANDLN